MKCIALAVVACVLVACGHAIRYEPCWSTQLHASTYFKGYVPGEYSPGYAALVQDTYLMTDVTSRLYAINKTTGTVQWTFTQWDDNVTGVVAAQRQIAGTKTHVFVLRGNDLYSLSRSSGSVAFHTKFGKLSGGPTMSSFGNDVVLFASDWAIVLDGQSGATKLKLSGTNSYAFRAVGDLLAAVQCSKKSCGIAVFNNTDAGIVKVVTLPADQSTYVMTVNNDYVFFLTKEYSVATLYDFTTKANRFSLDAPPCGFMGYGITANQFMFHYSTFATAYDLHTGKVLATTGNIQNLKRLNHIIGYENYIILGCTMNDGSFNVSAWSVPNGGEMAWSLVPPSSGTNLYGNFEHTLVIPAHGEFTLIDVRDGAFATVGPFPELSFASMVQTNTELLFAHNATVAAIQY
jgi:outer membrane protein assembly factor BamB